MFGGAGGAGGVGCSYSTFQREKVCIYVYICMCIRFVSVGRDRHLVLDLAERGGVVLLY
jgi:hypothetical protein